MVHRWYVVHAYSGFENKVASSIRKQAEKKGLAEEISQVMVPTEEVVEVRRGAKVNTERKFFPGYVLVKMDLTDDTWHLIKNTAKVTGFLGGGGRGKPVPISEAEAGRMGTALAHVSDPMALARELDEKSYALDHIDTKLATLPAKMQTAAGRRVADGRLTALIAFRDEFIAEWATGPATP